MSCKLEVRPYLNKHNYTLSIKKVKCFDDVLNIIAYLEEHNAVSDNSIDQMNSGDWYIIKIRGGLEELDKHILYGIGFKWSRMKSYEKEENQNIRLYAWSSIVRDLPYMSEYNESISVTLYVIDQLNRYHLIQQHGTSGYKFVTGGFNPKYHSSIIDCVHCELQEELSILNPISIKELYIITKNIINPFAKRKLQLTMKYYLVRVHSLAESGISPVYGNKEINSIAIVDKNATYEKHAQTITNFNTLQQIERGRYPRNFILIAIPKIIAQVTQLIPELTR